jgi:hypothetical protein
MFQSRKQVTAVDPPDLTKYKPIILNNSDGKEMRIILAASAILASIVSAQAATHHKHHHHRFIVRHSADHHRVADRGNIVAHPAGCPRSAFCGCGVSARVFGHSVRSLWLVRNWYQFPRAAAAPGNVVLFGTRHVAYIEAVHGDGTATLYDPNSGGGVTRMHRVRIAGLAIVSPNGHATAEARTPPHAYRVARRHYRYQEQRTRYAYNASGTTGFWH